MGRRGAFTGMIAAVLLLALAGCSGGSSSSGSEGAAPALDGKTAVTTTDTTVSQPREIVRNADVTMRVDDVVGSAAKVGEIATSSGGRVAGQAVDSSGDNANASMTLRVPAAKLDDVIARIGALGTVTSTLISTEDVTAQGVDLDARIAALQTSVTRLQQLLAEAKSTTDLLAIEKELSARQAELDSLTAQRTALSEAVAMSTVTVGLWPTSLGAESTPPGFLSGLTSGWSALKTVSGALVTVAGFLLPFLLAFLVVAVPVSLIVWAVTRRRKQG